MTPTTALLPNYNPVVSRFDSYNSSGIYLNTKASPHATNTSSTNKLLRESLSEHPKLPDTTFITGIRVASQEVAQSEQE